MGSDYKLEEIKENLALLRVYISGILITLLTTLYAMYQSRNDTETVFYLLIFVCVLWFGIHGLNNIYNETLLELKKLGGEETRIEKPAEKKGRYKELEKIPSIGLRGKAFYILFIIISYYLYFQTGEPWPTVWFVFMVLFFSLANFHRIQATKEIKKFNVAKRPLSDVVTVEIGGASIDQPIKDFVEDFNTFIDDLNVKNSNMNTVAMIGYTLAGTVTLISFGFSLM